MCLSQRRRRNAACRVTDPALDRTRGVSYCAALPGRHNSGSSACAGFAPRRLVAGADRSMSDTSGAPNTRLGTQIGGYKIESVIGRGGMSVIYLAEQVRLGRKVALKL